MLAMLARHWWAFALRGVVAVIFGILALIWPQLTVLTLVMVFGAYALVDGIFAVIAGIRAYGEREHWWAVVLEGMAGILIGLLIILWPGITTLVLLYLIAAWAIVTGILEVAAAIRLRRVITKEWAMALTGVLSVVLGVLLFAFPGAGAVGLAWLIGLYAILFGVVLIIVGLHFRGLRGGGEARGPSRL